jgi:hypothetical protein
MTEGFKPVPGQEGTVQRLSRKVLDLLKLVERNLPMDRPDLKPKAKAAEKSVEELVSLLEDSEKVTIKHFKSEIEKIRYEEINWNDYQDDENYQDRSIGSQS